MISRRDLILATVDDMVGSFVYYDRKEDELLSRESLVEAIEESEVSIQDLVDEFSKELSLWWTVLQRGIEDV